MYTVKLLDERKKVKTCQFNSGDAFGSIDFEQFAVACKMRSVVVHLQKKRV
jgi:hypothetical protein